MTKVAFMFPGQGSLEEGMGREIAEAVPAAMAVYRAGSEAAGIDLLKLCFDTPLAQMVETENRRHRARVLACCLGHREATFPDERDRLLDIDRARSRQRGELTD